MVNQVCLLRRLSGARFCEMTREITPQPGLSTAAAPGPQFLPPVGGVRWGQARPGRLRALEAHASYKDMFISPTLPVPERRDASRVVLALKAAGEQTRLRALALLTEGELAVGELAQALDQSQPRVSRHLKLLTEAGLVERAPEGAWVFYRLPRAHTTERHLAEAALTMLDPSDPVIARDAERLGAIRVSRDEAAAEYFERNAADWERVRALHLPEADIDSAILAAAGAGPFELMVDVGVGQGRMIQLFADRVRRAEGFDTSRQMLAIARASLDDLKTKAALRFGDAYAPPIEAGSADLVTIHQVLHFLSDPGRAIKEAARLLKPGGRLLIVDFAPHGLEFLREEHAHRRLGFADREIAEWCEAADVRKPKVTTLAPQKREALTVKIWAGEKA
jgi:ubiquinone/menaquinone biosynthesis C-methylase UbiE/DNA-binding transcriptional ArsR family regulator